MKKLITTTMMLMLAVSFTFAAKITQFYTGVQTQTNYEFDYTQLEQESAEGAEYVSDVLNNGYVGTISPIFGISTYKAPDKSLFGWYSSTTLSLIFELDTTVTTDPTMADLENYINAISTQPVSGFALDTLNGPQFTLDLGIIRVPLALGLHIYAQTDAGAVDPFTYALAQAGIGAMTGVDIALGPLSVFVHVQAAYDFFGVGVDLSGLENFEFSELVTSGATGKLSVMPQIGVGFKF
jgi:hypothetical protein